MPYSGAFAAARSSRFRRSTSLSSGAGAVRVGTGSPNSAKNLSSPAGATVHSSLAGASAVLRKAWGALAGMFAESPASNRTGGRSRRRTSIEPASAGRNEHVQDREAAVGLLTREQHGVRVADNREVDERLVVGTRDRELARWIIGCQRRRGSTCRVV